MAEPVAELQQRLDELEQELAEGDITRKGYDKKRTALLQHYLGNGTAELKSARTSTQSPQDHSRQVSYGSAYSLQPPSDAREQPLQPLQPQQQQQHQERPPSALDRFQEREGAGGRTHSSTGSWSGQDTLHPPESMHSGAVSSNDSSRRPTLQKADFAFNPGPMDERYTPTGPYDDQYAGEEDVSRMSTLVDSQQQYFSDFTGQQLTDRDSYGGPQRYSTTGEILSPGIPPMIPATELPSNAAINHQLPLEPRDIPFSIFDPHNPNTPMSKFTSLGDVLRYRGRTNGKQPAYWVLDLKGKEVASITWDKLASRAEKVAQVIRDKSSLYRGDRVALVYRDTDIIEFAVALLGCFIAGVVAVPVNCVDDYHKLILLFQKTQAHLALTTDQNLKAFERDIAMHKLKWPAGVEWWNTNDFGTYKPSRKKDDQPQTPVPELAYIEFSRAPTGDLRGVVLSHRTIMHQMACLTAIVQTIPHSAKNDTFSSNLRDKYGNFIVQGQKTGETILSYLDPREGIGMILGVLFGVYGGHTTVWMEHKTVETAGLYAHLITRYRASVMAADYSRLKFAAYNYQQDPMTTRNFKKGMDPNFSSVKICFIDTLTVDCEFHDILADRWFKPMRNERAREVVAPILCLPEHGGMIISCRDWLGGEERMGCTLEDEDDIEVPAASVPKALDDDPYSMFNSLTAESTATKKPPREARTDLSEVLLDKEALKTNEVVVLATGEEARRRANEPGTIRVGAFGYPIADATLAVVNPESYLLCSPYTVGEIWVDSPSLSGGFWSLPKHTETIFHARPYRFVEGSPNPVFLDFEFLRTGLLGCVIEGKVYVLGLYEDRIRQSVEWVEAGVQEAEHRYFFVQHLVSSIMKNVPKIHDCSAFDVFVNGEYLPIILIETMAASTVPLVPGGPPRQLDVALLDSLSERCMQVLYHEHNLRVYCVMVTANNTLPKVVKNGRKEIGNMLCRQEFDNGSLPSVHVQFGVERAVKNLPIGDDPVGGIWSPYAAQARQELLMLQEKQYSGVDHRAVVMDERTSTPLTQFKNIHDLLQWRVSRQSDELAYCSIDGRGREGRGVPWKKLDLKISALAMYLKNKVKVQPGDHLLLMYTHSEEFVYAVHACFVVGAIAIPMAPIDSNRLSEDSPALLSMVFDFRVKAILVNNDVDQLLKQKTVSQHLKQSANVLKVNIPNVYNTTKPSKQAKGCRDLGLTIRQEWNKPGNPVLIWAYWTPDQRRCAVQLGHDTIMELCKVQKETCQMTSAHPIMACVRSTVGLGFIHMVTMGIYLAAPTYLVSPVDFASNPVSLFLTLSRYKVKNTYATGQMLDYAIANVPGKGFALHELKNLMISTDGRPRLDLYDRVRNHFAQTGLDPTAINTIYSHVLNPMIASRSYMCVEPIELWLDPGALRRGLIVPCDPDEPFALRVQDSGMVPVSTQIAIVNPESNRLCHVGEYGEIWVQSTACAYSFYRSRDPLDTERFNGRTEDGDPNVRYVRTGDLGFLHSVSRPIGPGGTHLEMQILFVLGSIGETFEVNGLSYFPMDIESSVERCHRSIVTGGCAVFQAGGLVVVLVEVARKSYLASIVPVIINAVLNAHQLVIDIVAFVEKGHFPRSRLGEKQRGKILASWITKKMRTIAQFSIKEPEAEMALVGPAGSARRGSTNSFRNGSVKAGSNLKHVESSTGLADLQEVPPAEYAAVELPGRPDDSSIMESPPLDTVDEGRTSRSDDTPTGPAEQNSLGLPRAYSPVRELELPMDYSEAFEGDPETGLNAQIAGHYDTRDLPQGSAGQEFSNSPPISPIDNQGGRYLPRGGGGLRVTNASEDEDREWPEEALLHMRLSDEHVDNPYGMYGFNRDTRAHAR